MRYSLGFYETEEHKEDMETEEPKKFQTKDTNDSRHLTATPPCQGYAYPGPAKRTSQIFGTGELALPQARGFLGPNQ